MEESTASLIGFILVVIVFGIMYSKRDKIKKALGGSGGDASDLKDKPTDIKKR